MGAARIRFEYRVLRGDELLAFGHTEHAFMHPEGRAIRPPREIIGLFPPWPGETPGAPGS
jgi:acyl-CoA thioesterase FadM